MKITIPEIYWYGLNNLYYSVFFAAIILILLIYYFMRTYGSTKRLAPVKNARQFLHSCSHFKMIVKLVLLICATGFLFIALLAPQWNRKEEIISQEGRDLFFALDISRSMLASDCGPNRLTCAKNKIKKLVSMLSSERVGLILFAGTSIIQCPLTTDYNAFMMFLDQIDADTISSGTTAIDQAIKKAIEAFGAMADRKNKLLIIFTDGEDFSSDLSTIKRQAINLGMHIFTVGVGTVEGAPIPVFDAYGHQDGFLKDRHGNVVISRLNEGILSTVAQDSGSIYIRISLDDSDIRSLVSKVESYEKERLDDKKLAALEHQYHYFLLGSFLCLLIEWII